MSRLHGREVVEELEKARTRYEAEVRRNEGQSARALMLLKSKDAEIERLTRALELAGIAVDDESPVVSAARLAAREATDRARSREAARGRASVEVERLRDQVSAQEALRRAERASYDETARESIELRRELDRAARVVDDENDDDEEPTVIPARAGDNKEPPRRTAFGERNVQAANMLEATRKELENCKNRAAGAATAAKARVAAARREAAARQSEIETWKCKVLNLDAALAAAATERAIDARKALVALEVRTSDLVTARDELASARLDAADAITSRKAVEARLVAAEASSAEARGEVASLRRRLAEATAEGHGGIPRRDEYEDTSSSTEPPPPPPSVPRSPKRAVVPPPPRAAQVSVVERCMREREATRELALARREVASLRCEVDELRRVERTLPRADEVVASILETLEVPREEDDEQGSSSRAVAAAEAALALRERDDQLRACRTSLDAIAETVEDGNARVLAARVASMTAQLHDEIGARGRLERRAARFEETIARCERGVAGADRCRCALRASLAAYSATVAAWRRRLDAKDAELDDLRRKLVSADRDVALHAARADDAKQALAAERAYALAPDAERSFGALFFGDSRDDVLASAPWCDGLLSSSSPSGSTTKACAAAVACAAAANLDGLERFERSKEDSRRETDRLRAAIDDDRARTDRLKAQVAVLETRLADAKRETAAERDRAAAAELAAVEARAREEARSRDWHETLLKPVLDLDEAEALVAALVQTRAAVQNLEAQLEIAEARADKRAPPRVSFAADDKQIQLAEKVDALRDALLARRKNKKTPRASDDDDRSRRRPWPDDDDATEEELRDARSSGVRGGSGFLHLSATGALVRRRRRRENCDCAKMREELDQARAETVRLKSDALESSGELRSQLNGALAEIARHKQSCDELRTQLDDALAEHARQQQDAVICENLRRQLDDALDETREHFTTTDHHGVAQTWEEVQREDAATETDDVATAEALGALRRLRNVLEDSSVTFEKDKLAEVAGEARALVAAIIGEGQNTHVSVEDALRSALQDVRCRLEGEVDARRAAEARAEERARALRDAHADFLAKQQSSDRSVLECERMAFLERCQRLRTAVEHAIRRLMAKARDYRDHLNGRLPSGESVLATSSPQKPRDRRDSMSRGDSPHDVDHDLSSLLVLFAKLETALDAVATSAEAVTVLAQREALQLRDANAAHIIQLQALKTTQAEERAKEADYGAGDYHSDTAAKKLEISALKERVEALSRRFKDSEGKADGTVLPHAAQVAANDSGGSSSLGPPARRRRTPEKQLHGNACRQQQYPKQQKQLGSPTKKTSKEDAVDDESAKREATAKTIKALREESKRRAQAHAQAVTALEEQKGKTRSAELRAQNAEARATRSAAKAGDEATQRARALAAALDEQKAKARAADVRAEDAEARCAKALARASALSNTLKSAKAHVAPSPAADASVNTSREAPSVADETSKQERARQRERFNVLRRRVAEAETKSAAEASARAEADAHVTRAKSAAARKDVALKLAREQLAQVTSELEAHKAAALNERRDAKSRLDDLARIQDAQNRAAAAKSNLDRLKAAVRKLAVDVARGVARAKQRALDSSTAGNLDGLVAASMLDMSPPEIADLLSSLDDDPPCHPPDRKDGGISPAVQKATSKSRSARVKDTSVEDTPSEVAELLRKVDAAIGPPLNESMFRDAFRSVLEDRLEHERALYRLASVNNSRPYR